MVWSLIINRSETRQLLLLPPCHALTPLPLISFPLWKKIACTRSHALRYYRCHQNPCICCSLHCKFRAVKPNSDIVNDAASRLHRTEGQPSYRELSRIFESLVVLQGAWIHPVCISVSPVPIHLLGLGMDHWWHWRKFAYHHGDGPSLRGYLQSTNRVSE